MNKPRELMIGACLCVMALQVPAQVQAQTPPVSDYSAADLLSPCQEADNDARWGEAAETECEQYIMGFVEALSEAGITGVGKAACPPSVNTADEVRWAYMRWVHADYTARRKMPAAAALMETLKSAFPCQ